MSEYCENCEQLTETKLIELSSGHIGRVCVVCHKCRRFRPYATKQEYINSKLTPTAKRLKGDYENKVSV